MIAGKRRRYVVRWAGFCGQDVPQQPDNEMCHIVGRRVDERVGKDVRARDWTFCEEISRALIQSPSVPESLLGRYRAYPFTTTSIAARPLLPRKVFLAMAQNQKIRRAEGILRSVPDPGQIVCDPSVIPVHSISC